MEFKQVAIWTNGAVRTENIEEFENFVLEKLGIHIKYIEEFKTLPDRDDPSSSGRNDVLFYVATEDIPKFTALRFAYRILLIEDVLNNEAQRQDYSIYPESMKALRCW